MDQSHSAKTAALPRSRAALAEQPARLPPRRRRLRSPPPAPYCLRSAICASPPTPHRLRLIASVSPPTPHHLCPPPTSRASPWAGPLPSLQSPHLLQCTIRCLSS